MAAKALGAMVKGHGDESFQELVPWLLVTLESESSTVDRSGSAQGRLDYNAFGFDRVAPTSQNLPASFEFLKF